MIMTAGRRPAAKLGTHQPALARLQPPHEASAHDTNGHRLGGGGGAARSTRVNAWDEQSAGLRAGSAALARSRAESPHHRKHTPTHPIHVMHLWNRFHGRTPGEDPGRLWSAA